MNAIVLESFDIHETEKPTHPFDSREVMSRIREGRIDTEQLTREVYDAVWRDDGAIDDVVQLMQDMCSPHECETTYALCVDTFAQESASMNLQILVFPKIKRNAIYQMRYESAVMTAQDRLRRIALRKELGLEVGTKPANA